MKLAKRRSACASTLSTSTSTSWPCSSSLWHVKVVIIRQPELSLQYRYIKVTTLSGVSYASVYEQTHSRQCCNLFISGLWTQPVIVLPSIARACDNQSTVHLDWQLGCQFCACMRNVWGITKSFASYFDLVFVPFSWISRRESSGYTFATITQTYEVF